MKNMKKLFLTALICAWACGVHAVDLAKAADWGMKTWAEKTFEPELGDIGPKTYDKVCELILRLKGNMLAPAMHSCTGPFYSHPESQAVADKWGIMITTSHCEPLLFNNASQLEWDKSRDGDWNYETNRETILAKLDSRRNRHVITLSIVDPGQIIQKITVK